MGDLYIYYRVRDGDAAALAARVCAMQARLALAHPVTAQLKRRPGSADGLQTWMEIYNGADRDFDAALDAAVQEAALSELISGERHTEVFTDLDSCA
ncbi:MAG: DUF4936 family protein [Pseudomonadota bacterium]